MHFYSGTPMHFLSGVDTVALQFADDLLKPIAAGALRQEQRLQRAGIVRKRVRHACHTGD